MNEYSLAKVQMIIICLSITVIAVRFKGKIVFSCFCFQMFVITQLRDKWYGHGVRNRS